MSRQLQIRIYPDGKVETQTVGIKGKKCMEYIPIIEELLEAKTEESALTSEYYEQESLEYNEDILEVRDQL